MYDQEKGYNTENDVDSATTKSLGPTFLLGVVKSEMAKLVLVLLLFTLCMAMPLLQSTFGESSKEVGEWLPKLHYGKEKVTRFHFYVHDTLSGKNISAVIVARASITDTSPTLFGAVFIFYDPLTEGPEGTSRLVGRAQGFYGSVDQQELGLVVAVNFVFTIGKFNASSLIILGKNAALNLPAETPIIGGTGIFRFARGFVMANRHFLNGNGVLNYNVFAIHY